VDGVYVDCQHIRNEHCVELLVPVRINRFGLQDVPSVRTAMLIHDSAMGINELKFDLEARKAQRPTQRWRKE